MRALQFPMRAQGYCCVIIGRGLKDYYMPSLLSSNNTRRTFSPLLTQRAQGLPTCDPVVNWSHIRCHA